MRNIAQSIVGYVKKYWPYVMLVFIECLVMLVTYEKRTYLIGWDNLFPEFNLPVNITRALNAAWQEYRGMGVVDSMSHASTLIEDIERSILAFVFPTSFVRWIYLTLLHLMGGLGIIALFRYVVPSQTVEKKESVNFAALFGALFYQYNLGIIQQMFLPMEVFVVQFAFLPWLIWAIMRFLDVSSVRRAVLLAVLSILATPQAHVPTLFIVYSIAVAIVLLSHIVQKGFRAIFPSFMVGIIIFMTNAFWMLPFGYATITHSKEVASSKAFEMASSDIFYRNHKYGNMQDVLLMKGTLLDYHYYDFKNTAYHFTFQPWLTHISTTPFQIVAWFLAVCALSGLLWSLLRREAKLIPIAVLYLFCFTMLGTDIPIVGNINFFLREHIPLFATVFRFVFTKFSILFAFSYSMLIAYMFVSLFRVVRQTYVQKALLVVVSLALIVYTFPILKGNLYYRNLKVPLPKGYTQAFSYLQKQNPHERIALLPIPWYWSWLQPDWGTINSGFLWYAIPQPTTDLAFTPWSNTNENFYWELNQALIEHDITRVEKIFDKYDITRIYFDKTILDEQNRKLTKQSFHEFLLSSSRISVEKTFEEVTLYRFSGGKILHANATIYSTQLPLLASQSSNDRDELFNQNMPYVLSDGADVVAPFASLFSGKSPTHNNISIYEKGPNIILQSLVPYTQKMWEQMVITTNEIRAHDSIWNERFVVDTLGERKPITYELITAQQNDQLYPAYQINTRSAMVYDSNKDKWYTDQKNDICPTNSDARMKKETKNGNTVFRLTSKGTGNCIRVPLPTLEHGYSYLMRIEYEADTKRGWFMNVYNTTTDQLVMETYLRNNGKKNTDYFILPPGQPYGMGYTAYFNNKSEGVETVSNALIHFTVYQIPYHQIKNTIFATNKMLHQFESRTTISYQNPKALGVVSHPNPAVYTIQINPSVLTYPGDPLLYLSQSYDEGWVAYQSHNSWFPFFGDRLEGHVRVNNWANGWKLEKGTTSQNNQIVIVFWPQYLEYAGLALLGITFVVLTLSTLHPLFKKQPRHSIL